MSEYHSMGRTAVVETVSGFDGKPDRNAQNKLFLEAVFLSSQSNEFTTKLQASGLYFYQLPEIVRREEIQSVVGLFEKEPDTFRFQRAVFFSLIGVDELSPRFRRATFGVPRTKTTLFTEYSPWYLCDDAEKNLVDAVSETGVMALGTEENDSSFILKFNGKMSALCLQDTMAEDGKMFIKGNWYSPTDTVTKDELTKEFDIACGRTAMRGKWALMRSLQPYDGRTTTELIGEMEIAAKGIPDFYPNMEIDVQGTSQTRKTYRSKRVERG